MSATNRGAARRLDDAYDTPDWLAKAIMPHLLLFGCVKRRILEPACGSGAVVRELQSTFGSSVPVEGIDLVPRGDMAGQAVVGDFLTLESRQDYDLIITNPPYSLAEEFCQRAMLWRRDGRSVVVMLLRLNFLASQRRAAWLRKNPPAIYVTPRRPSFTGNGTDATEYAWFVWDDQPSRVVILDTERVD